MDVSTTLKANVITLDVTASRVVGQTIGQNIVQIDRKPAFQEVSKVYGPPGAKGDTGAQGAAGAQGVPGLNGKDGKDGVNGISPVTYPYLTADTLWVINHNLGLYPTVAIFTMGGVEVEADVLNTSLNQVQISFTQPTAGFARLS